MTIQADTTQTDYYPIRVHITGSDVPVARTHPRRKRVTSVTTTKLVKTNDTDVYCILPQSDNRVRATIWITTGAGGTSNSGGYGWIADSISNCQQHQGAFVTAAGVINVPIVIHGQNAIYFMIDSAATNQIALSIISDYEED